MPRPIEAARRRGAATLWLILIFPILIIMLVTVIEVGHMYVVRAELGDSLDAAALAAVERWGKAGGGDTLSARTIARDYASFNTIGQNQLVTLDLNYLDANPNDNAALTGPTANIIFGEVTESGSTLTFNANSTPGCSAGSVTIEARGKFRNEGGQTDDGYVRFRYSTPIGQSVAPVVIDSIELNLRGGLDADAVFEFATPYNQSMVGMSAPSQSLHNAPTPSPVVPAPAPIINIDFPATGNSAQDFNAPLEPAFDEYTIELRTRDLFVNGIPAAGTFNDDGDGFGRFGVTCRITFRNTVTNQVFQQNVDFIDNGDNDDFSTVSGAIGGGGGRFAVRVARADTIPSLVGTLCGLTLGPLSVKHESIATYDCGSSPPAIRLIKVDQYIPPTIPTSP